MIETHQQFLLHRLFFHVIEKNKKKHSATITDCASCLVVILEPGPNLVNNNQWMETRRGTETYQKHIYILNFLFQRLICV